MSKIQKIKKAMASASDNDATKAIKYLLWYIESQEKELSEARLAYRRISHHTDNGLNFANWIGSKRGSFDRGEITLKEYEDWFKTADENSKYIIVAGKKVPKDP